MSERWDNLSLVKSHELSLPWSGDSSSSLSCSPPFGRGWGWEPAETESQPLFEGMSLAENHRKATAREHVNEP